jgi:hypothetical protein
MKVTKWWKKLSAAIVAAGFFVPGTAHAVNIPLGDPSFEDYVVPARGYAYAADPLGAYRPTSAWVDDLDNPPGYTQDDGASNWIYNLAYGESSATHRRAAPRTGNQAMHGYAHYNAQETSAVFEAGNTYTFSVWAQGDIDGTGSSSGVFMYIFDGNVAFSDANSLATHLYTVGTGDFANRGAAMTPAQSQANWTKISLSHLVAAGAPEIGHPVGVGFFGRADAGVDDASLSAVPEPTAIILVGMGGLSLLGCRRRRN